MARSISPPKSSKPKVTMSCSAMTPSANALALAIEQPKAGERGRRVAAARHERRCALHHQPKIAIFQPVRADIAPHVARTDADRYSGFEAFTVGSHHFVGALDADRLGGENSPWPIDVAASHLALEAIDVRGNFRPLALVPLDAFAPQPPYSDGFRDPPLFRLAWYGHRVGSGDKNAQGPENMWHSALPS